MRKLLAAIIVAVILMVGLWWFVLRDDSVTVTVANTRIPVELALTPEQQAKGLSNRSELPKGHGMLFVFNEDDYHRIWMKEMRFAIDILWISAENKVVSLAANVAPETYDKGQTFSPSQAARYVLELPAGTALEKNLNIGDSVKLPKLTN